MLPRVVRPHSIHLLGLLLLGSLVSPGNAPAEESQALQERLDEQQRQINALQRKVDEAAERAAAQEREMEALRTRDEPIQRRLSDRILIGGQGDTRGSETVPDR